jgi:hypothetical protein
MPDFINNIILKISDELRANGWYSHGMTYLPLSGRPMPVNPMIRMIKFPFLNNELERSPARAGPRPIREIPRALRFGKQTTNNKQ